MRNYLWAGLFADRLGNNAANATPGGNATQSGPGNLKWIGIQGPASSTIAAGVPFKQVFMGNNTLIDLEGGGCTALGDGQAAHAYTKVTIGGGLAAPVLTNPGSGCTSAPSCSVDAPGSNPTTAAKCTATESGGAVTGVTFSNTPAGYWVGGSLVTGPDIEAGWGVGPSGPNFNFDTVIGGTTQAKFDHGQCQGVVNGCLLIGQETSPNDGGLVEGPNVANETGAASAVEIDKGSDGNVVIHDACQQDPISATRNIIVDNVFGITITTGASGTAPFCVPMYTQGQAYSGTLTASVAEVSPLNESPYPADSSAAHPITNFAVIWNGSGAVRNALTTSTVGVIGVCASGCNLTGPAIVARTGNVAAQFDGAAALNDYVQISSSSAGQLHDAGSTCPVNGQVLGVITAAIGSAGLTTINLGNPCLGLATPSLQEANTVSPSTYQFTSNGVNPTTYPGLWTFGDSIAVGVGSGNSATGISGFAYLMDPDFWEPNATLTTPNVGTSPYACAGTPVGSQLHNYACSADQAADMVKKVLAYSNPSTEYNPTYLGFVGGNDATNNSANTPPTFQGSLRASIDWATTPSAYKVLASAATASGTWVTDTGVSIQSGGNGLVSTTNGSTLTFTIQSTGNPIELRVSLVEHQQRRHGYGHD